MTETEWLVSDDPQRMLQFLTGHGQGNVWVETGKNPATDRKLRLFACACCLRHRNEESSLTVIENLEFTLNDLRDNPCEQCVSRAEQAALLRDICGNPYRLVFSLCGRTPSQRMIEGKTVCCCDMCQRIQFWNDRTIPRLAEAIYDERAFDRMPILADALEEAGCAIPDILMHCRGMQRCWNCLDNPACRGGGECADNGCKDGWITADVGPHVRGCWVLDLLLGKS